jgi:squalene-hopene/tetraprenyl-beta-curcumene cyclase
MNEKLMTQSGRAEAVTAEQPSGRGDSLVGCAGKAIERSAQWLLDAQAQEGYWWGELEADTTLESDYILYEFILGRAPRTKIEKLANYIRRHQLEDGGWNIYFGGPAELNATVKAYFSLKLAGDSRDAPHMELARARIHDLGGFEKTNSYVRFYLALIGAIGWEWVPAVPPELMLLPSWFFVNILEMSSWTRGIVVPMMILCALRPDWRVPVQARVDELFLDRRNAASPFRWDRRVFSMRNLFLLGDRVLKGYERLPWKPFRRRAMRVAERWLREHLERSDGLGTIYPAMMNAVLALIALGYPPEDPLTAREIRFFDSYEIEERDTMRLQPCISPVWDTAIAMVSLEEAGLPAAHPALTRAAGWLLEKQILGPGDWQAKNPDVPPGGWAFEFRNDFFPDVDDTAFVLMALGRVDSPERGRQESAIRRGTTWLLSMQNRDGGWGAFDKNNDMELLTYVPFADHNAMLDPSTADVTARVIEWLGQLGWPSSHPVMRRAMEFLEHDQTSEGPWYGRWGVNYIYGSSGVLRALDKFGLARREDSRRAAEWIKSVQNRDGGFGESIASYEDAKQKGKGVSTASQTAWALIGLLAVCGAEDPAVERAVSYLVETQNSDGTWNEREFTGTGFPQVFYLKYHLYRNSFPLYALARFRNLREGRNLWSGVQFGPEEIFIRRNGWRPG